MNKKIILWILFLTVCVTGNAIAQWTDNGSSLTTSDRIGIGTTGTSNGIVTIRSSLSTGLLRLENNGLGFESLLRFRSKTSSGEYLHADITAYADGDFLGFKVPHNSTVGSGYRMVIKSDGNVGIGTTTPNKRLHVNDSNGNQIQVSDGTDNGWVGFSAPDFTIWNHDVGGNIRFVFGNGSGTERVTFQDNGHVGIGTTNPTELLTVAGTAKAEEVIITEDAGADFVFQENYDLPDLTEVEAYIKQFKHLSGIPTAGEMIRDGVKVGELQMKLLQKIEELTLYAIGQENTSKQMENNQRKLQDQIERLVGKNEELTQENRQLRHRLEKIEEKLNVSSN